MLDKTSERERQRVRDAGREMKRKREECIKARILKFDSLGSRHSFGILVLHDLDK